MLSLHIRYASDLGWPYLGVFWQTGLKVTAEEEDTRRRVLRSATAAVRGVDE